MLDLTSFFISVPASALGNHSFHGSVFGLSDLMNAPLPSDLRLALEVITAAHKGTAPLRCIARPEIFTHGIALKWLKKTIGDMSHHLSLSDGSTIKFIPDFQNHLFAYGLQSTQRHFEFRRLLKQAPELLAQCNSQLNSFYRSVAGDQVSEPIAQPLMSQTLGLDAPVWFFALYLNPHSVDDSINNMMSWGDFEGSKLEQFERVVYVPFTERSLGDRVFQCYVADVIVSAYFDSSTCLIMRLPSEGGDLTGRMKLAVEAICAAGRRMPRVRALNIFLLADNLSERSLRRVGPRLSFVVHHSFEYWRYTRVLFQSAGTVVFFTQGKDDFFHLGKSLTVESFGQQPTYLEGDRLREIDMASG